MSSGDESGQWTQPTFSTHEPPSGVRAGATHDVTPPGRKGRWKHPVAGMGWYRKVKRDFAALA